MSSLHQHYQTLDAPPSATLEEIRVIYRDLAQVWHPDRFPNNARLREKAETKLKAINHAYETIQHARKSSTPTARPRRTATPPRPQSGERTTSPTVPAKEARAFGWYAEAAENGHADAQCIIATMYEEGKAVPKDEAKALVWFQKAAAQSHPAAEFQVGLRYYAGRELPKDLKKAFRFYERAALGGHVKAQFYLGLMLANGEGIEQDNPSALAWFEIAASNRHLDAGSISQAIAVSLTSEQLASATEQAAQLRERIRSRQAF